jgi:hypothetical protein
MLTMSLATGLAGGIAFGALLLARGPVSLAEEGHRAESGHRIAALGLAAIVGTEAFSGTLAAFVASYSGEPPTQVVRSALTILLCWLTFKGNRFAYWLLVMAYGIAIAVILPTAVARVLAGGPTTTWSTWLLLTIWVGAILAITVAEDGRRFIQRQQLERRERRRA